MHYGFHVCVVALMHPNALLAAAGGSDLNSVFDMHVPHRQ
jgi:hypothetical protein